MIPNTSMSLKRCLHSGSVLVLSPTLWPESNSSAAGVRTSALLEHFASTNTFENVMYASGSQSEPKSKLKNVSYHHLPSNRTADIRCFLDEQNHIHTVIFDRFFAEEAYSFQFYHHSPKTLRVLDMQDMHSLRYHRQNMVQDLDKVDSFVGLDCLVDGRILKSIPSIDNRQSKQSLLLRELAAIHRSDLVMVCSNAEMSMLTDVFHIHQEKLVLSPFFVPQRQVDTKEISPKFEERRDFVFLGGFKHFPNIDQVKVLKNVIWKRIRSFLPDANLHIFGAYAPSHIHQMNDKSNGFLVHGYVENLDILRKYRVMLAPVRYGAGLKGKIVDSWIHGCPVVTTSIGGEGMMEDIEDNQSGWGGLVGDDNFQFVQNAVHLYSDPLVWNDCHENGFTMLHKLFDQKRNFEKLDNAISYSNDLKDIRRRKDYTSALLWDQNARSTEYFSKWIELKEISER